MGKRKKYTAKDYEDWHTKDYMDAVTLGVWKVERKFADEIKDAVKNLNLTLKLDKITKYNCESFIYSCLLQLRRKDIYQDLNQDFKKLADKFSYRLFITQVCDFMLIGNQTKISKLRQEFESSSVSGDEEDSTSWNAYWTSIKNENDKVKNYWFMTATALLLGIDIMLVEITGFQHRPYQTSFIYGSDRTSESTGNQKLLYIGKKTDLHYQSLLPSQTATEDWESDEETSEEEELPDSECPHCGKMSKHLLIHIARAKDCKENIEIDYIESLRQLSKVRHKGENAERKAKSRKRIQARENRERRQSRLALQCYYKAKSRENLKKKFGNEEFKEKERVEKESRRLKQKQKRQEMKEIKEKMTEKKEFDKTS